MLNNSKCRYSDISTIGITMECYHYLCWNHIFKKKMQTLFSKIFDEIFLIFVKYENVVSAQNDSLSIFN